MLPKEVLEINTTLPNIKSLTVSEPVPSPTSPVSPTSQTSSHTGSSKKQGRSAKRVIGLLDSLSAYPDSRLRDSSQTLLYYTDDSSSLYSPRSLDGIAIHPRYSLSRMNSCSTTDSQQTRVRMVGRGGSGSKPRPVQTLPPPSPTGSMQLQPVSTSLSAPPLENKRRFVGRGGSGSKQRKIKGKEVPRDPDQPASPDSHSSRGTAGEESQTIVRPHGRGGAGSRPRAAAGSTGKGSSSLKLLWPKGTKARKLSGPLKMSPGHTRQLSSESSVTADFEVNVDISPGTSKKSTPDRDRKPGINIDKVARTMGELPPHMIYQQLLNKKHPANLPKLDTNSLISSSSSINSEPPSASQGNSKSKRNPLSLLHHLVPASGSSSTSSLRSSGTDHKRESLAPSQRTLSTCGTLSDLHRFALADDLSESWGEVRDDSYNGSPSSESPITFSPPTPIVERPPHSLIHPYRYSISSAISSVSALPATVNHAVMSDTKYLAGVSSSSSSIASSHGGRRPALSLSIGSTMGLESSNLVQDASEDDDVRTPVNASGTGSAATTSASKSPLPSPSGPTSATTAVSKQQQDGVQSHSDSLSSLSHCAKPSLMSLSSTASSGVYSTRPDTPFGDYALPQAPVSPPASKRRWSITEPYDGSKDVVIITSSRTSTSSASDSQGWSGEWNTKLPDVIHALRLL